MDKEYFLNIVNGYKLLCDSEKADIYMDRSDKESMINVITNAIEWINNTTRTNDEINDKFKEFELYINVLMDNYISGILTPITRDNIPNDLIWVEMLMKILDSDISKIFIDISNNIDSCDSIIDNIIGNSTKQMTIPQQNSEITFEMFENYIIKHKHFDTSNSDWKLLARPLFKLLQYFI